MIDIENDLELEEIEQLATIGESIEELSNSLGELKETQIFLMEKQNLVNEAKDLIINWKREKELNDRYLEQLKKAINEINEAIKLAKELDLKNINDVAKQLKDIKEETIKELNKESYRGVERVREVAQENEKHLISKAKKTINTFEIKITNLFKNRVMPFYLIMGVIVLIVGGSILTFKNDYIKYENNLVDVKQYNKIYKQNQELIAIKEDYLENKKLLVDEIRELKRRLNNIEKGN